MKRLLSRPAAYAAAVFSCGLGSPALAAGGAQVVDDAAVEIPGTCHVESWVTRYGPKSGFVDVSPACTREAWPNLEIGVQHAWDGKGHTSAGAALKLNLRPIDQYGGMAISTAASLDTRTGRVESASVIVPITLPVSRGLSFSANAGYSYLRTAAHPHSIFWGGQLEAQIGRDISLMVEGFGRAGEPAGAQAGLRWTPHGGAIDVDLLVGHYIDGTSPRAVTLGLTVRR